MRIYDPYAFNYQELDEAVTTRGHGSYTLVKSLKEGKWFALYMPTNKSLHLSELSLPLHERLETKITTYELTELLLETCGTIREGMLRGKEVCMENLRERYGAIPVKTAQIVVIHEGYSKDEVARAFGVLDYEPTTAEILEGVETLRVSDILEEDT